MTHNYHNCDWSNKRIDAVIAIYSTLLQLGQPELESMDKAVELGTELINRLKTQQSKEDEESQKEMDILLGRTRPHQSADLQYENVPHAKCTTKNQV